MHENLVFASWCMSIAGTNTAYHGGPACFLTQMAGPAQLLYCSGQTWTQSTGGKLTQKVPPPPPPPPLYALMVELR